MERAVFCARAGRRPGQAGGNCGEGLHLTQTSRHADNGEAQMLVVLNGNPASRSGSAGLWSLGLDWSVQHGHGEIHVA
jgi:hypothetical protein